MTTRTITLLQMNDSHGYIESHPELFWQGDTAVYEEAGGFARIATLFKQARAENPGGVIALDNGDTFHGTFPAVHSQGEALVPLMNALAFDAMTAHWEFAYGPRQFEKILGQLNYPMLAINCYRKDTDELAFPPAIILERGGLRVGVIGIAATIIDKTMPAKFSEGLRFTLGRDELPGHIARLRDEEGVDLVVVLSHLGLPQEIKLATEVDGIDILLSGHTHNRVYEPMLINGALLIQSGCHGSFIGRLDLRYADGAIQDFKHQLIRIDDALAPEPRMAAMVDAILAPHRMMLNTVVGYTDTPLNRNTVLEATMDNLLLQAISDASGAKIAFSNGWRYGAPILPGPITMNDLWNIIPTNPPVSLVELTGMEMMEMMEMSLERTFACDAYQQMGGYVKRCFGVNIYFKIENPKGLRIHEFFINGEPLQRDRSYTVAFVTEQGVPKRFGQNRRHLDFDAITALKNYLGKHEFIFATLQGTVVAI